MKDSGPNWGLAFGSGSFLIVWLLGFLANISIEVVALRACVATIIGSLVGIVFGQVLRGVQTLKKAEPPKGQKIDFTLPADDLEMPVAPSGQAQERQSVVPQAAPGAPAAPSLSTDVPEAFQPLDFKKAARQIQNTIKE